MKENAANLQRIRRRLMLLLILIGSFIYVLGPQRTQAIDCYAYAQQYYNNCMTYGRSHGFDCDAGDSTCCYHEYVQELEACLYP
jgi:hypothetical protein